MARGSMVTPVWRPKTIVSSTTRCADFIAASTPPVSTILWKHRLLSNSLWIFGSEGSSARSASSAAGSSSYATSTASTASSASARDCATTATQGSPCQRATSMAGGDGGGGALPSHGGWNRT